MRKAACCWCLLSLTRNGVAVNNLAREMARWLESQVANEIRSLPSGGKECRAVFCGPPPEMLLQVFNELAGDGRLLSSQMADGTVVSYPVVLQVDEVPVAVPVARADQSGFSMFHGLATLRNDRNGGVFVTLVPPAGQASDTHDSTRKSFGVAPTANEGGAQISIWWNDPFIEYLVDRGLGVADDEQLDHAKRLLREAVIAADAANQHEVNRTGAWQVLARLWELREAGITLDARVSLAAGFPPSEDGRIDATHKVSILDAVVDKFERANLGAGVEQLKERAAKASVDPLHLDTFLGHLRARCEVVTALKRSMPYFYAPDAISPPPEWWKELTIQKWEILLDDDADVSPEITVSCTNPLAFQLKGFVPVVRDHSRIEVRPPEDMPNAEVRITRVGPGGAANHREWTLPDGGAWEIVDDAIPLHRTPIKYVAEIINAPNAKKGSVKVISLSNLGARLDCMFAHGEQGEGSENSSRQADRYDVGDVWLRSPLPRCLCAAWRRDPFAGSNRPQ